ncbi:MAG: radical SAM protein [Spirochaetia bacterium]
MLVTHALRILLGKQLSPFSFVRDKGFLPDFQVPNTGLYVHIPFCETLCSFCPYFKEQADEERMRQYLYALLSEIDLTADKLAICEAVKREATSLYFGGGSPAIMIDDLSIIRKKIDRYFHIKGNAGIELHPRDIHADTGRKLLDAGFDMVSLGIQSFSQDMLRVLGREDQDLTVPITLIRKSGFKSIDVDLIFGIPGQDEEILKNDFLKAAELGATQISAYPFINFSYANNNKPPQSSKSKKRMLNALLEAAEKAGFHRNSVWTFGKKGAPRYSSITRDCFIGFGPSATSLGADAFKVNTFSVDAYIDAVHTNTLPTALRMPFTPRSRRLYWLFWNCYNGHISKFTYNELFSSELDKDFHISLHIAKRLGILYRNSSGWELTKKGSYYFHKIEQLYTHQYIDKTWRFGMKTPWPERIDLY